MLSRIFLGGRKSRCSSRLLAEKISVVFLDRGRGCITSPLSLIGARNSPLYIPLSIFTLGGLFPCTLCFRSNLWIQNSQIDNNIQVDFTTMIQISTSVESSLVQFHAEAVLCSTATMQSIPPFGDLMYTLEAII